MLESKKIELRRSEVRQQLATLAAKTEPTADELRSMETLSTEYNTLETRYRASLLAEDTERREAGRDLETRGDREWSDLVGKYELRQAVLFLDEGAALSGQTAEVVSQLRGGGGFRGVPVPYDVLRMEKRTGETVASGILDPVTHRPIIEQLFPSSVATRLGGEIITIDSGTLAYPLLTAGAVFGWQSSETAAVGAASAATTSDKTLKPDYTAGTQMVITRRSLKQAGPGLEMAIRRDMNSAMAEGLDAAVLAGSGVSGQPTGFVTGAPSNGVTVTDAGAGFTFADIRSAVVRFLNNNALASPGAVTLGITPAAWELLDAALFDEGSGITEWDKLLKLIPSPVVSTQIPSDTAVLTTAAGGVPPFVVGLFGAIDLIRDPFTQAASGSLVLTALATMDTNILRAKQIEILSDLVS